MQFNRLSAFTLGVIITAASVGAVTFANAAVNGTLKACANKSNGAMRYISKGSCKKTETSLSWSQMGSQGLPGAAGVKGDTGAAGTNGTNGSNGTNGQNFHIIDAAGRDLGVAIGIYDQGNTALILHDGGLWTVSTWSNEPGGGLGQSPFFSNSLCTSILAGVRDAVSPMARGMGNDGNNKARYFKATGEQFMWKSRTVYAMIGTGVKGQETYSCKSSSDSAFKNIYDDRADEPVREVLEVIPPTYTAPFTPVAK